MTSVLNFLGVLRNYIDDPDESIRAVNRSRRSINHFNSVNICHRVLAAQYRKVIPKVIVDFSIHHDEGTLHQRHPITSLIYDEIVETIGNIDVEAGEVTH